MDKPVAYRVVLATASVFSIAAIVSLLCTLPLLHSYIHQIKITNDIGICLVSSYRYTIDQLIFRKMHESSSIYLRKPFQSEIELFVLPTKNVRPVVCQDQKE